MISIRKRFIFVHVPKTGGNSIQNILRDHSEDTIDTLNGQVDGFERFEVRNATYNIQKHSTLAHYRKELGPILFPQLFKFATIRNPWDMMISWYFSPHSNRDAWDRAVFLRLLGQIKPLRDYVLLNPQPSLQGEGTASRVDRDLDRLLRFERLNDDFQDLCRQLDIPGSTLPIRNRSSHNHYSTYYDDELRDLVGNRFHEEVVCGQYEFARL